MATAFHCIKAMFLTTDMFFYPLDIERQRVRARIRTQYFDSHFVYIWKVVQIQKAKLPVAITNIIWLPILELENSVSLDLVLFSLRTADAFPVVASLPPRARRDDRQCVCCSQARFSYVLLQLLSTLSIVFLDGPVLILRQLPCGIQSGEETNVGQRLNRALESLFTFTSSSAFSELTKALNTDEYDCFPSTKTQSDLSSARNILLAITSSRRGTQRLFSVKYLFGEANIAYYFFSKLASGRNPPNPAVWLVPKAGSFLRSCPLTRAESLTALFTSLLLCCLWMSKTGDF